MESVFFAAYRRIASTHRKPQIRQTAVAEARLDAGASDEGALSVGFDEDHAEAAVALGLGSMDRRNSFAREFGANPVAVGASAVAAGEHARKALPGGGAENVESAPGRHLGGGADDVAAARG